MDWHLRDKRLRIDRPIVMGIVNVTPDSFSEGGRLFSSNADILDYAATLIEEGADILDVGGESTRPGANPVSEADEMKRVLPVVEALAQRYPNAVISVDTLKSSVARAALDAGAHIVNDVSGLRLDPRMGDVVAKARAGVVIMHSRGDVADMASFEHAEYGDVVGDVLFELRGQLDVAERAGIPRQAIAVDPGLGFAKRGEHSLAVLGALPELVAWGYPVLVGASRKRFIGEITGVKDPAGRLHGTLGANVAALARGARIFRVHDVRPAREALDVAWAVLTR
ncbi:MAG TPA: dihydropteroate synthase [Gemmatimonadaceae bacterium]|nr:dihydropteroate synthase [Gemmatimonadaceae bacterium]